MGKLIKNHWARLIVLTAAACSYSHLSLPAGPTNSKHRSSARLARRLLLAQDLLGFSYQDPRWSREAVPRSSDHQPALRLHDAGLGMAVGIRRRIGNAQKHRGQISRPADDSSGCCVDVPNYQSRPLLHDRTGGVLLGLQ